MSRDGLTLAEAKAQLATFYQSMQEDLANGGSPWDWADMFESEFGLEPDYFEDIVFSMC